MTNLMKANERPLAYIEHLKKRNLVHDQTPQLENYLGESEKKGEIARLYAGFDPSAPSLQAGNLVAALLLRRAQLYGIQPLVLMGGATGLIGDPSGKKAERTLLDKSVAEANLAKNRQQLSKIIDLDAGKYQAKIVNNYDWFKDFHFLDFLRDVGKHISINYMLAKDSVKTRMETGISYAEFGYMLVQGYDFLHLFEEYGCAIQVGGSDQWGNMTTGIELIRRKHQKESHAVSAPLLTDAAGNKLGKSEAGAIYLDPEMTSPYQFFQYWLNLADSDVIKVLNALTLLDDEYIAELQKTVTEKPELRAAQKVLANELTIMIHGQSTALAVDSASKVIFSKDPKTLDAINEDALEMLCKEVPNSRMPATESMSLIDALVEAKLAKSKGEARRHIKANAVAINRIKINDEAYMISADSFNNRNFLLLGLGKAKLHLILR